MIIEAFTAALDAYAVKLAYPDYAAIKDARARVLDAYAAVCRERDEWAQLKDSIGRDLGAALGRVQALTDEVGRLRADAERYRWLLANVYEYEMVGEVNFVSETGRRIYVRSVSCSEIVRALDAALSEGGARK